MARSNSAQKILDSAATLFARHGYAGTIMDELAELAKVNKATIYYHFKDKDSLYETVLVKHLEQLFEAISQAVSDEKSPLEKLKAYIKTFAYKKNSKKYFTSIMMREIAGGGDKMPDSAKAQMHKILMIMKGILLQGIKEDIFVDADALTLHMMIIGSFSFYIASEPMRKAMTSSDADLQNAFRNSTIEDVSENIFLMVKNALLKTTKEDL